MLESDIKSGEKNKLIPGWLLALIIIPCFAGAILFMIFYMGGTFDYIANIQISWFDGYYVVITSLLTVLVYLVVLLTALIPAKILIRIIRPLFEKDEKKSDYLPMNERSKYQ